MKFAKFQKGEFEPDDTPNSGRPKEKRQGTAETVVQTCDTIISRAAKRFKY